jgi:hypothetical protein
VIDGTLCICLVDRTVGARFFAFACASTTPGAKKRGFGPLPIPINNHLHLHTENKFPVNLNTS